MRTEVYCDLLPHSVTFSTANPWVLVRAGSFKNEDKIYLGSLMNLIGLKFCLRITLFSLINVGLQINVGNGKNIKT